MSTAHKGWADQRCYACLGCGYNAPNGDDVRTCSTCHGNGGWWKHLASGVLAEYPGGPFMGSDHAKEMEA